MVGLLSCGRPAPEPNAAYAWRMAEALAALGPRPGGSPEGRRTAEWLAAELRRQGLTPRLLEFEELTSDGPLRFCNVEARIPGRGPAVVVVGAHYDTKALEPGFVGVNDSCSGPAALLALARAAGRQAWPFELRLVFFDGEECRREYGPDDGLHGSRRYVEELREEGRLGDCRALILLDLVGDRDLSIAFPPDTDPELLQLALREARRRGWEREFTAGTEFVVDDQVPFLVRGVPVINFIDLDYGPGNAWWHSPEDTLDKLSLASLGKCVELALALLRELAARAPAPERAPEPTQRP